MIWVVPRNRKSKKWIAGALGSASILTLAFAFPVHAEVHSEASIAGQQFSADGSNPGGRVDFGLSAKSAEGLPYNSNIPKHELHFYSFFETDAQGDRGFDLDHSVVRIPVLETGHVWIGRAHPLNEGFEGSNVFTTGAIGANWVQNQSNALEPRVSGWIGTGVHYKHSDSGLFGTASFSPVFLPSFGPSVQFSETADATGSRFARLPPLYITIQGVQLPLRYRINTGDIMKIVLQPQYFAATGHDSNFHRFTLMAWSAPSPNPTTTASGILRVPNSNDVNVFVTAIPSFPRENFVAAQWSLKKIPFFPTLEAAYETVSQRLALSGRVRPLSFFETGFLTTLTQDNPSAASGGASVSSPLYAKDLFWAQVSSEGRKFRPSLRYEQHLAENQKGQWFKPQFGYMTDDRVMLFAGASFLTGEENSYFGTWRNLDSVSMGASYSW